ncbi:MAG: Calx-beta domain-containing protein, partial [Actinomycetota bacterium]
VGLSNGSCRCGAISIPILGDNLDEDTETFQVNLSSPSGATIVDAQAIGTIYDNEGPPAVVVTDTSDDEFTGTMSISVLLTGPSAGTVTMDYATAAGSATAGSDYTTTTGSLSFISGQTSKNVSVPITSDAIDEDDETFSFSVANVAGAGITAGTGIGTIVDDDAEPDLSIANASVTEGNAATATASFTLTLSAASAREITVEYGTADGSALAGSDYSSTNGTLTFAAGETSKSIDVPVTGDAVYEGTETYAVSLSSPSNAVIADADAVGTITDDDPKPSFSIDDVSVIEGNAGTATATFTVSMSNPSAAGTSVQWATSDGSALAGSDYEAGGATLTFTAGDVSRTVHVTIDGDTVDESDETFGVTLSTPTGATIADANATGTITDDDKTSTALILKAKKTTKAVKAVGVIEAAATGMKVKVTLFKKQGGKYVKVLAKTVTVSKLGDRDADGIADAAYAAAFKRPKKGAYRFVAKYAGSAQYLTCGKKLNVKI